MYQSKYYTCEEIDERLLKGYYDDAVSKGYNDTFEQFKTELASIKGIESNTLAINQEAQARAKADEQLNTAIEAEVTRAEAAEKLNADAIATETARAMAAEEVIQQKLTELSNNSGFRKAYLYSIINPNNSAIPSFNTETNTLTIPSQNILAEGKKHAILENTTIVVTDVLTSYNYGYILYNYNDNEVYIHSANLALPIENDIYLLGIVSKMESYFVINSKYWKIDDTVYSSDVNISEIKQSSNNISELSDNIADIKEKYAKNLAYYYASSKNNYPSFTSQVFTIPSGNILCVGKYFKVCEKTSIDLKSEEYDSSYNLFLIVYSYKENSFKAIEAKSVILSSNDYLFAILHRNYVVDINSNYYNSEGKLYQRNISNTDISNIVASSNIYKDAWFYTITDKNNQNMPTIESNVLSIKAQNILIAGFGHFSCQETTINIAEALSSYNYGVLLFNKSSKEITISPANISVPSNSDLFKLGIVSKLGVVVDINSKYYKLNGIVYSKELNLQDINTEDITEFERQIIMGKHLYCIDGEILPLYKSSLVTSNKVKTLCLLQKIKEWNRFSEINFDFPKYNYFDHALYFDATDTPDVVTLSQINSTENVMFAVRNIMVHHVDKSILSGKTVKYLPYGASNTGFGWGRIVAEYLKKFSCTVKTIGVLRQGGNLSGTSDPCYGEGRGGWGYLTYIGKKPYNQGSWITYPPAEQAKDTFTYTMNPFMRPVTDDDKQNYPEYCFPDYTHAGQDGANTYEVWSLKEIREKGFDEASYGQFYIYDFQWYIDNRPVEVPDVMTIQLGLNDSPAITASQFALPWILGSITKVAPNCKIGICPSPAVQQTISGDNYVNNYSSYNNWLNTYLEDLGNSNVTVLNLAASMNRQFDFAFNSVLGTNVSEDGNLTEKVQVTKNNEYGGSIHSDNNGLMEIGKCIGAFVANNLPQ